MPNTRSCRGTPTSRETPADTHLRHLTTEVLRLRLGQLNLVTTGSRSTLLARLTTALKDRPNASANQQQRSQTADDDLTPPEVPEPPSVTREPRVEQTTGSGGFTSEQLDTLKCLISSSIEDSILRMTATLSEPLFNAVTQPSQPPTDLLSPSAPSSLFDHLPEKTINSITNDQQCQVAIPPTRSAEISTATKPAPPNRAPTSHHRCNKPGCNGTHSAIDHDAKFTDASDKRRQRR